MQKLEVGINFERIDFEEGRKVIRVRIDPGQRRKIMGELRHKATEWFEEVDRERREAERKLRIYRHCTGSAYLSNAYQPA